MSVMERFITSLDDFVEAAKRVIKADTELQKDAAIQVDDARLLPGKITRMIDRFLCGEPYPLATLRAVERALSKATLEVAHAAGREAAQQVESGDTEPPT